MPPKPIAKKPTPRQAKLRTLLKAQPRAANIGTKAIYFGGGFSLAELCLVEILSDSIQQFGFVLFFAVKECGSGTISLFLSPAPNFESIKEVTIAAGTLHSIIDSERIDRVAKDVASFFAPRR